MAPSRRSPIEIVVESPSEDFGALLTQAAAESDGGVSLVREEYQPGAFESLFVFHFAVAVVADVAAHFATDAVVELLKKHARRVDIAGETLPEISKAALTDRLNLSLDEDNDDQGDDSARA